jgi:uncharacterized protein DUF4406
MTGLPGLNFPAFAEATARLRLAGHEVISPAEHDEEEGWVTVTRDPYGGILTVTKDGEFSWDEALDWDLDQMAWCDGIYLLPGWSHSRGACREYWFAQDRGLALLGAFGEAPTATVVPRPLVGLIGFAQAGKDTVAGLLGYQRIAFADPLKALALACNPIFQARISYHHLTQIVGTFGWEYAKSQVTGVREFLQNLGVGVREHLGPDTWVEAAFRSYDPTQPTAFTDVRFPNEVAAIRDRGGSIVRVTRVGLKPPNNHVSEQLVSTIEPDFELRANEGDLNSLAAQTKKLDAWLRAGD